MKRLALAILMFATSGLLLSVGLISLFRALDDQVELPAQGTIQDLFRPSQAEPEAPVLTQKIPPVRMIIDRIGVDAEVVTMGMNSQGAPDVPTRPDVIAWYDFSAAPGQGSNAVFSGHVDWTINGVGIEAVFYRLKELEPGDVVRVVLQDGTQLSYAVVANVAVPFDDPNAVKVMDPTTNDVLTLITCGGTWLPNPTELYGGNYSHRIIARAELMEDAVASVTD